MATFVRIGSKGDITSAVYAMEGDSYWRFPWAQRKDGQTPDFATPTWVKPVGNGWNSVDTSKLVATEPTEEQVAALALALTEEGKKATLAALKGTPKEPTPEYSYNEYGELVIPAPKTEGEAFKEEVEAALAEATEAVIEAAEAQPAKRK